MSIRVVLHPARVTGLLDELRGMDDIDLVDAASDDEVVDAIADGAGVLVTYTWRDRFLHPNLRWIQGIGAGFEQYPLAALDRGDVVLTTATGVHIAVAEGAWALLLALTRRIADAVRAEPGREWKQRQGPEIAGSTIGILGLGAIGEAFAERAHGWDATLIGFTRRPDEYHGVVDEVLGPDDLLEVCRRCDIVVSTLPGSAETHHLIGAAELDALGHGYLVNVGRGTVVDEAALIDALRDGRLAGAGLDVFETEPLAADSPLWDLSNAVVTPHSVGNTPRYGERLAEIFGHNLRAFRGDDVPWINRVVDGRRRDRSLTS